MKFGCSYFGNRIVRHVAEDMKLLKKQGFTFVVHTFSEFDLQFHKDNIGEIVEATHAAGLEAQLDPWGIGNVFGGEPFSNFAAQNMFTACQVLDDGSPAPFACPNSPVFRDFMREWIDAATKAGTKVIFWDEPHFFNPSFLGGVPGRWGCRCEHCKKLFEQAKGFPMPSTETDDVKVFKRETLYEFIDFLTRLASEKGLRNDLCVPAHVEASQAQTHWLPYAKIPRLSVLGTDPYWQWHEKPVQMVSDYSREVKKICDQTGLQPQIWIQVCRIKQGTEQEIRRAVNMAVEAGITNLAAWGFEGCANESWIRCDDPEKAWDVLIDSFQNAGEKS